MLLDGFHEFIAKANRNIGLRNFIKVRFKLNEIQHVRVSTVDGNHQCAAAPVLADKFRNQRIESHKGNGTARFFSRVVDAGAFWTELRNIDAATAAVAIGTRQFPGPVEDAFNTVFRRCHDVAIG